MKNKFIKSNAGAFLQKIRQLTCICILIAVTQNINAQSKEKDKEARCGFSKELMVEMNKRTAEKIKNLRQAGKLNFTGGETSKKPGALAAPVLFRWPLSTQSYRDFPSWHISNFVDLDASTLTKNYNCYDNRTYDGHTGTDIGVDPYSWEIKNSGFVKVVAAADGIIVDKHDGENDESCGNNFNVPPLDFLCTTYPNNQGNYIIILHNDGTTASFYMHMKNGSVTGKQEGDAVSAGEYLGTVASAGCSTGPHLHFEVRKGYINDGLGLDDYTGTVVDPFVNGTCAQGVDTYWIDERPYNDPAITALETHSSNPEDDYTDQCDKTINLYYDNSFTVSQSIWFRSKFRDWINDTAVTQNIYKPNGNLWHSFTSRNRNGYRSYIPADSSFTVSAFDNAGTYRYAVTFGGKEYSHYFAIACQADNTLTGAASGQKGNMVSNTITSTQTISGSSSNYIKYMADGHVTLNVGFRAFAGCRFVANTLGCNNSTASLNKAANTETAVALVKENAQDKIQTGLTVFPNPSAGVFTVRYSLNQNFKASVIIRNMLGQVVHTVPAREYQNQLLQQVNITGKPKGIYLVEILIGDKRITSKVLVQ